MTGRHRGTRSEARRLAKQRRRRVRVDRSNLMAAKGGRGDSRRESGGLLAVDTLRNIILPAFESPPDVRR